MILLTKALCIPTVALAIILSSSASPAAGDPEHEGKSLKAIAGAETMTVAQARRLFLVGVPYADVRNPRLDARRYIPNAYHLALKTDFNKKNLEMLVEHNDPVDIDCSGIRCGRSSTAAAFAVDWVFAEVKNFREGIVGWRDAGLRLVEAQ